MMKSSDGRAAAMELYRAERRKLAELEREAEELLNEGEMLCRERALRKAEIVRERLDAMKAVALAFGVDPDAPEKSGKGKGRRKSE